jgi:hypothetical protein
MGCDMAKLFLLDQLNWLVGPPAVLVFVRTVMVGALSPFAGKGLIVR